MLARSSHEPRRSAERIPTGRPTMSQITAPPSISDSVAPSRSAIRPRTGTFE